MTPKQMALSTRQQLADLAPTTKVEVEAWIRNRMFVVISGEDEYAVRQTGRMVITELQQLFKPAPEAHLGATRE